MKLFAVVAALATLAACSSETSANDVEWAKYPDGTWTRIEGAECREMQELFDAFADMDDAIRTRHGEGSGDILGYLDTRMRDSGCYS